MANRYNLFYFEAEFKKYLIAGKSEPATIKNYLSDLHYFFLWLQNTQHIIDMDCSELPELFSHSLIKAYRQYLQSSTNSEKTVARRLATIRKFVLHCMQQQWLSSNPMDEFDKRAKQDELQEILSSYENSLQMREYSKAEIACHINVIRELITNSSTLLRI